MFWLDIKLFNINNNRESLLQNYELKLNFLSYYCQSADIIIHFACMLRTYVNIGTIYGYNMPILCPSHIIFSKLTRQVPTYECNIRHSCLIIFVLAMNSRRLIRSCTYFRNPCYGLVIILYAAQCTCSL